MSARHARSGRRLWRIPLAIWIAGMVALGAGGGAAYAYFGASGSGTGTATVGKLVTITVNASSSPTATLFPGGVGAVYFTLTNTNSLPVTFTTATAASVESNSTTGCEATTYVHIARSLPYTLLPTSVKVGANTTSGSEDIATFVSLSATAPTACQGKSFTISLTLQGMTT